MSCKVVRMQMTQQSYKRIIVGQEYSWFAVNRLSLNLDKAVFIILAIIVPKKSK